MLHCGFKRSFKKNYNGNAITSATFKAEEALQKRHKLFIRFVYLNVR